MKRLMVAALALTMIGGAAFAQNTTPKQETKTEVKAASKKVKTHKKKAHTKMKEAAKETKTEAAQ